MAFYKSEKEFWSIIEVTSVQVESVLADYSVETRGEALAGTRRGGDFRIQQYPSFAIVECGTTTTADYFLNVQESKKSYADL